MQAYQNGGVFFFSEEIYKCGNFAKVTTWPGVIVDSVRLFFLIPNPM